MGNETAIDSKFTSADLALLPENGKRYEIIEGELYGSRQPGYEHQYTCNRLGRLLDEWNDQDNLGVVLTAPGLIFAEDDDVAPDVVWITRERLANAVDAAGHLHTAPELVIEGSHRARLTRIVIDKQSSSSIRGGASKSTGL